MNQRPAAPYRHLLRCLFLAIAALTSQTTSADLLSSFSHLFDPPDQTPHSAVVRIYAKESGALASGSGTLIHVDQQYGYVITNWHVVREANEGQVVAVFPDSFESAATVLKTDERWDLALLRIWRPNASPMPLSKIIPAVGESLTIIGYGSGRYRAANGRCQYYAAPDNQSPQEMIEVSVAARQGDSGGPIVNQRGELAAVLFGSGQGITTGTHVGRVVRFLNSAAIPTTSENQQVAAERVVEPGKTQQASLVTQRGETDDNRAAQYYKLPPLEWSTTDDKTEILAATAGTASSQPLTATRRSAVSQSTVAAKQETPSAAAGAHPTGATTTQVAVPAEQIGRLPDRSASPADHGRTPMPFTIDSTTSPSRVNRQVTPLLGSRTLAAHNPQWPPRSADQTRGKYSTGSHRNPYNNTSEEVEVVQLPKLSLRRVWAIIQSILAFFGIVTLLEKLRN